MPRWPGGLIRKTAVTPAGPYQNGAAPGVWTIAEAAYWVKQSLWPLAGNVAPYGVFGGGYTSDDVNVIDRVIIATLSNATDFGDLANAASEIAAVSSSTRGVFSGRAGNDTDTYPMSYITIANSGNSTTFGEMLPSYNPTGPAGASNYVRGIFGGGDNSVTKNVIQYITIASTGNSIDFGDLTQSRFYLAGCASSTRALFAGGSTTSSTATLVNTIDYITIATTGNATDFGDLTVSRNFLAGSASSTRGVFGGGYTVTNVIDYVTIASTGDATDFGDLSVARNRLASCASDTRSIFGGGYDGSNNLNVIDYITIASTGNATDFGDLSISRRALAACSNAASAVQATTTSAAIALLNGGYTGAYQASIQYVNIATTGDAMMFGELTVKRGELASCSSSTRAVSAGGTETGGSTNQTNVIDYTSYSSFGISTDFGDLTVARRSLASASNATTGLFAGGDVSYTVNNTIDYITIASAGNATDFGDLTVSRNGVSGCASTTRATFGGGNNGSVQVNVIDYVTIASAGNAIDFGDLSVSRRQSACFSSDTRGIWAGGSTGTRSNVIDYITIASAGNATDFGDMLAATDTLSGSSSTTRGLMFGGGASPATNVISYVTIASTGNATDFGDLPRTGWEYTGSCSNAHGGL
jgi:hypothetical protein